MLVVVSPALAAVLSSVGVDHLSNTAISINNKRGIAGNGRGIAIVVPLLNYPLHEKITSFLRFPKLEKR